MKDNFSKVKDYVLELEYNIVLEDENDEVLVVSKEDEGISNLVLGCADPLLIIEQYLFDLSDDADASVLKQLLQKNRDIIHGAFVLDDSGRKVIFRDTLQLENLDLNELEGSINSLSLLLSEYADEMIKFSQVTA